MFALRYLLAKSTFSPSMRETLEECIMGKRCDVSLPRKVHVQASGSGQMLCAPISVSHNATCGDVVQQIETVVGACTCFVPDKTDPTSMGRHITARSPGLFTGSVVDVSTSPSNIYVFSCLNMNTKFRVQRYKTIEDAMMNEQILRSHDIEVGCIYKRYYWKRRRFERFQVYDGRDKTQDEIIEAVAVFLLTTDIIDIDLLNE